MRYNNKQLLHSAEMLWDNCTQRHLDGVGCKNCRFSGTHPYHKCTISGPTAWPMTRIREEFEQRAIK